MALTPGPAPQSMYSCEYNEEQMLGVWAFHGDTTATEWNRHFADLQTLIGFHGKARHRPAVLMTLDSGAGRPDAMIRQRLAQITALPAYNPYLAMCTRNPLTRGVLTALRWVQPSPHYEVEVFAEYPEGLRYLEKRRGEALPELAAMVKRAHLGFGRSASLGA